MPAKRQKKYNCLACTKEDNLRMVRCDNCDGWYHFLCVGVTSSVAHRAWRCSSCSALLATAFIESQQDSDAPNSQNISSTSKNPALGKFNNETAKLLQGTHETKSINDDKGAAACPVGNPRALQSPPSHVEGCDKAFISTALSEPTRKINSCLTSSARNANKGAAKSTCSQSSKASSNIRRLHAEMQFMHEQHLILQQKEKIVQEKETLLFKQRELAAQFEEQDAISDSDDDVESCGQVETWLKEASAPNILPTGAPRAESTTAAQEPLQSQLQLNQVSSQQQQDPILREILDKLQVLELKCNQQTNSALTTAVQQPPNQQLPSTVQPNHVASQQQQDSPLRTILDKLHALEIKCDQQTNTVSASEWLPGMFQFQPTNPAEQEADISPRSNSRITRDQLAARNGICKELPKFVGNPEEWPLFLAGFEQTTTLCGFSDQENLIRLRQALEGPARQAVKNLLLHASCVPQIISTLEMKFGRPELIIDVLLSQIREMPPPKESRPDTIVDFAIEVQNICATMKASGLLNHLNNPELEHQLVCKLPGLLGPFWGMHKLSLPSSTLEDFSNWLFQLAKGANSISIPSTSTKVRRRGTLNTHIEVPEVDSNVACVICQGNCPDVSRCRIFLELGRSEKWKSVRRYQLCRRCLKQHRSKPCTSTAVCGIDNCRFIHHPSLHNKTSSSVARSPTTMLHCEDHDPILFRVLPVTLYGNGVQLTTFAFFDDGSSLTLIDEDLVSELNLKGVPQPLCLRWTSNSHRNEDDSVVVSLEISEAGSKRKFPLKDVHTVKSLDLPLQTLDVDKLQALHKHLKGLPLTSYTNAAPKLLIGLNNCRLGLCLKSREGRESGPVAEKTRLGWTIKGQPAELSACDSAINKHVFHICDCEIAANAELTEIVKSYMGLDNAGVDFNKKAMTADDQHAYEQLQKVTMRIGDRFQTGLLWKAQNIPLPNSLPMAIRRAKCLYSKIQRDPALVHQLQSKIDDYIAKGYARKLLPSEINDEGCWYLPLFFVSNPNKPGKLRLMWDAATRVDGVSLNSMLLKGPDQLTSLVSTIYKFRQRRVAIGGDIAEMYHQIRIRKEDQNYQRFLWMTPNCPEPEAYVMMVMTFGATCSPSCAQYVKNLNADDFRDEFPRAVQCILENHYVDDMLDSVDTEEEAIKLANDVHLIHSKGGFLMRNWVSNSKAVLNALNAQSTESLNLDVQPELATEKVLGMWWSTSDDCFVFKVSKRYRNEDVLLGNRRPTKREVLSLVMTIFDPLGLLAFFVMYAKIIFQNTWRSGCAWDEQIHDEEFSKWLRWLKLLPQVASMRIPRCYINPCFNSFPDMEMHTFVDASEEGYAAVSYLRCSEGNLANCVLLGCKTRVAPLKMMSVPRLELQAAVLGARLAKVLISSHSVKIARMTFWSDSRTVLSWIRSDHRRYRQFVAFRVSEILELSNISDWRWIPTTENVADEATKWQRTPDFSNGSRWLNGPAFLSSDPSTWPKEPNEKYTSTSEELRTQYVAHHTEGKQFHKKGLLIEPERFSSWKEIVQVIARVIRFARLWKNKTCFKVSTNRSFPTQPELQLAEKILWRQAQINSFIEEISMLSRGESVRKSSSIYKLSPYVDSDGLLRLGGRVALGKFKDPVILPRGEHITHLVVLDYHCKYHHVNQETVVNEIRQNIWIPRLRAVVSKVRRSCQLCKNRKAEPSPPKMASLPPARLASFSRPFSFVGVDYFGPMLVSVRRSNEKRYGVLLTCLTTRAIHLELANTLSTDSCIIAIRNFIARRGSPIELWSDNGTNFKGAERELNEAFAKVDQNKMIKAFTSPSTVWRFIPPASPHMGGAWERLVRSVKDVLYMVLPSRNLNEELLRGALMEVEMVVNSRPLTYVPISHECEEALTPNHFLMGSSSGAKPLTEITTDGGQLRRNWQTAQQLANAFWKRWVREYLPVITRRCKWFNEVKAIEVNDIVYIVDPDSPRNCWPKGRVVATRKGTDGKVRSALVKTVAGIYERPATKIAVLDVYRKDEVGPREDIPGGSVTTNLAMR